MHGPARLEAREDARPKRPASIVDDNGANRTTLRVEGMDCTDEVAILEKTFKAADGIRDVRANLMASKITVTHEARATPQTQNFKISYHTATCPECKRAEYACICPPEKGHGHEHKPGEKEHQH